LLIDSSYAPADIQIQFTLNDPDFGDWLAFSDDPATVYIPTPAAGWLGMVGFGLIGAFRRRK
jgi:hypothetical protein